MKPYVTCKEAISDLDFVPDDVSLGENIAYKIPAQSEYQNLMRKGSHSIKIILLQYIRNRQKR